MQHCNTPRLSIVRMLRMTHIQHVVGMWVWILPWLMWWGIRINDLVNAYRMSHELYLYGCARNSTYYHIKDATTAIVSWRTEWVTNSMYEWECAANSTHYHSNDVRPPPADVPWDPRQTWRCCDGFYTEWVTNSTYHYNKNVRPSPADVACDPHQRYGDRFRNNTERVTNSTYYYNKDVSPSMADVAWDPHQRRRDGFHKESVKNSTAENASRTEPIRMRHEPRILPHQLANAVIVSRSTASIANFTYEWVCRELQLWKLSPNTTGIHNKDAVIVSRSTEIVTNSTHEYR